MRVLLGRRVHSLDFTDQQIIAAYDTWKEERGHTKLTDNMPLYDILRLRDILAQSIFQDLDMLCLHWFRNEIVALRKKGLLGKE